MLCEQALAQDLTHLYIAEALPRTRGLKAGTGAATAIGYGYCRGIAPNEGTESAHALLRHALTVYNCRGIAPNEGTESYG